MGRDVSTHHGLPGWTSGAVPQGWTLTRRQRDNRTTSLGLMAGAGGLAMGRLLRDSEASVLPNVLARRCEEAARLSLDVVA